MENDFVEVTWSEFKSFVDARSLSIQFRENSKFYYMRATDQWFGLKCDLSKDAQAEDVAVFEASYKSLGNKRIEARDSEGALLSKGKITASGNTYDQRSLLFETAKLNSIANIKSSGDSWGDATLKFYDVNGTELTTQNAIDTDCVKTVIDWEPTHTYDLIGGFAKVLLAPQGYAATARIWIDAIPDIPQIYGGSINMVDGRVLEEGVSIIADGRGTKTLPYDVVYHTNRMRTTIRHLAGNQLRCELVYEIYYTR